MYKSVLVLALIGLISCGASREVATPTPAPTMPPQVATATPADTETAAKTVVPEKKIQVPVPSPEELQAKVDRLIREVEKLSAQAQDKLKAQQLVQAKADFETALDLILSSGIDLRSQLRLKKNFDEIFNFLYQLESQMPAEAGQGESQTLEKGGQATEPEGKMETDQDANGEQALEPAAIDELENVNIYPITIEPDLRERVVEDIANTHYDVPVVVNEAVLQWLEYFKTKGRRIVELGLKRIGLYRDMIHAIFSEAGLPKDLIYLAQQESMFKPLALSRSRARGMWQFISGTGKLYGLKQDLYIDEKLDPEKSTRAAAKHLQKLYQMFGDWYLAMAAYNAGEGRIQRIIEKTGLTNFWDLADRKLLREQTVTYVPSILAFMIIGKHPEKYGFEVSPLPPIQTQTVTVPSPVDLSSVAVVLKTTVQNLYTLNPELRRKVTPPNQKTYQLNISPEVPQDAILKLASLPLAKRALIVGDSQGHYKVQTGDSLWIIARHHGISLEALMDANHLTSSRLKIGQELVLPSRVEKLASSKATKSSTPIQTSKAKEPKPVLSSASANGTLSPDVKTTASNGGKTVVHQVRRGDNLYSIARRYKTTIASVRQLNNLNTDSLRPGDTLLIYPP